MIMTMLNITLSWYVIVLVGEKEHGTPILILNLKNLS